MIAEIVEERLELLNKPTEKFQIDMLNIEHFFSKFMTQKYG